jgi:hypothetical protein
MGWENGGMRKLLTNLEINMLEQDREDKAKLIHLLGVTMNSLRLIAASRPRESRLPRNLAQSTVDFLEQLSPFCRPNPKQDDPRQTQP